MAKVTTQVVLERKEIDDALIALARTKAGFNGTTSAKISYEMENDKSGFTEILAAKFEFSLAPKDK